MQSSNSQRAWFGAEAKINDKPMLVRGRRFVALPMAEFASLLVVVHRYKPDDQTGLPNSLEYDAICRFEAGAIDGLESARIGVLTFVETHDGIVRYYCYVRSIDESVSFIETRADERFSVEFSAKADAEWNEYHRLMSRAKD